MICTNGTEIKGRIGVSSNFITHLKRCHPESNIEFTAYKNAKKMCFAVLPENIPRPSVTKSLVDYFTQGMVPLCHMNMMEFRTLLRACGYSGRFMSRDTLRNAICSAYEKKVNQLKLELKEVKFLSLTSDIWSNRKKSFIGFTCHWIDEELKRRSVALVCQRFTGNCTLILF